MTRHEISQRPRIVIADADVFIELKSRDPWPLNVLLQGKRRKEFILRRSPSQGECGPRPGLQQISKQTGHVPGGGFATCLAIGKHSHPKPVHEKFLLCGNAFCVHKRPI